MENEELMKTVITKEMFREALHQAGRSDEFVLDYPDNFEFHFDMHTMPGKVYIYQADERLWVVWNGNERRPKNLSVHPTQMEAYVLGAARKGITIHPADIQVSKENCERNLAVILNAENTLYDIITDCEAKNYSGMDGLYEQYLLLKNCEKYLVDQQFGTGERKPKTGSK